MLTSGLKSGSIMTQGGSHPGHACKGRGLRAEERSRPLNFAFRGTSPRVFLAFSTEICDRGGHERDKNG
jgi:hypothetical protein